MTKTENLYTPDCIRTFSGQYVNVFNPDPDTILIEDIAHALSQQCRFGGHLPYMYSVAAHSIMCCYHADHAHKLAALMHDASEAYLLDIPSPIKKRLSNYNEIEDSLMAVISKKFGFEYPLHNHVKELDKAVLDFEWRNIMLARSVYDFIDSPKHEFLNLFIDSPKHEFLNLFNKYSK